MSDIMNKKERKAIDYLLESIVKASADDACGYARAFESLMAGLQSKREVEAKKKGPAK